MAVSDAVPGLSPGISHLTYHAAYAPFTPSDSEQRLGPSYYRGCWHEVSRPFLFWYYQSCPLLTTMPYSQMTGVYNPKTFILHAALRRQACAHCEQFPTAASRRSLGRVSVPVWPVALSGRLPVVALVSHYLTNKLIGREVIFNRKTFQPRSCDQGSYPVLAPVSRSYPRVEGRFFTCSSPVRR